jgi:O-acetylserine/cysteine efflux transporter
MKLALLVLAAALWGLATTGTKYALGGFAPVTLLTVELVAATAALWIALLVRGYRPPASWHRVAVLGLLEPAGAYLAQTIGLDRTSAANGAVLLGFESVFVVGLASVFLGEHISRSVCGAVGLALVGFLALESGSWLAGPGTGDVLVLGGALSAAGYTIVARGLDERSDSLATTAHQFAVATLAMVPVAMSTWAGGAEPFPAHVPARFWLIASLVGIAGFGLSFLLYNYAIVSVPAGPSAVIINLIPAFGFVGAVVLLGEAATAGRVGGATLITGSVLMFAWTQRPDRDVARPVLTPAAIIDASPSLTLLS